MCQSNLKWGRPYDPPIISIETTHALQKFRYSPDFSPCKNPDYLRSVTIIMTGNRAADFRLCNEAAGYPQTPSGYTWHHKYMVPYTPDNTTFILIIAVHCIAYIWHTIEIVIEEIAVGNPAYACTGAVYIEKNLNVIS